MVFTGLQNVVNLSLINNVIRSIRQFGFYGLSNLILLDLHQQNISVLSQYAFSGMINLQTLNLSYNAIRSLRNRMFAGIANLKFLDIQHNGIMTLDVTFLSMLENLSSVFLTKADLCCFLSETINCIFSEDVVIVCDRIFTIHSQSIVAGICSALIICFNISAITCLIYGHTTLKSALGDTWFTMHLSDSLHGLHMIVLVIYDTFYGDFFVLEKQKIHFQIGCALVAMLPLFSCMNAIFSVLVIVLRLYICVYMPFKAKVTLDRASPLFHMYWIIPVGLTWLKISFLHLDDRHCLYYLSYSASSVSLITSIAISIIELSLFLTNFLLASLAVYWIRKSAHQAGREFSTKDMYTLQKLFVLNMVGLLSWVSTQIYYMSEMMSIDISNPILIWMIILMFPFRPVINPMITLHMWMTTRLNWK